MTPPSIVATVPARSSVTTLLPIVGVVFVAFTVIGLALPVLPLHVHADLGFGTLTVGLVAGAQFGAALISRFWSGAYADTRGAKRAVVAGLLVAAAAGLLYLLSLRFLSTPRLSVMVLLVGRGVLGGAESFITVGALGWSLALVGQRNAGVAMAWVGTAMYIAYAVGAPIGTTLYGAYGFAAIAVATTLIPLVTLVLVARLRGVAPTAPVRPAFMKLARAVWMPGVGLAFSSVGFAAITTFIVLLFAQRGWGLAWLAFTLFSGAFALGRVLLGHLPDKIGGAKVALFSVALEAAGQTLICLAPSSTLALVGAALTCFGYTLVYPALGVEAVRGAPPQSRALATGAYTAFLDVALGLANPALGWIADATGVRTVFLVAAVVVLGAAAIAAKLMHLRSVIVASASIGVAASSS